MKNAIEIKIRGYHLDVYQHVNNARYLEFLEEARWDLLDNFIDKSALQQKGLAFNVVRIAINFKKGATLDQVIKIDTRVIRIGKKSITLLQEITDKKSEQMIADAEVIFVFADMKTQSAVTVDDELIKLCGLENVILDT